MPRRALILAPALAAPLLAHAAPEPAVETEPNSGIELVRVPGGAFDMGSRDTEDAQPIHRVQVGAFWLSRYEVTHGQYARFMAATGHAAPSHWTDAGLSGDRQPVVGVTYADAAAFCAWVGGRLPTEAEWEYAARGTDGRRYPWGDAEPTPARAVFHLDVAAGTKPVGTAKEGASPFGIFDLAGSVFEWCSDWYGERYYAASPARDPAGPETGRQRVVRGGSWVSLPDACRSAARAQYPPASRSTLIGIRVAR
jgi:formylglycine-generating enzyme required for sulfatase activity